MKKGNWKIRLLVLTVAMAGAVFSTGILTGLSNQEYEKEKFYIYFDPIDDKNRDLQLVQQKLNEYLEDQMDIQIELLMPANYEETLTDELVKSNQIDLAYCPSGAILQEWVSNDWLYSLDEWIDKDGEGIKEHVSEEYFYYIDDKLYVVTTNRDRGRSMGLEYHVDLAEQYGIDMTGVTGIEDLERIFEQVKEKCPEIVPTVVDYRFLHLVDGLGDYYGVLMDITSPEVVNLFETEEFLDFLRTIRQWQRKGYLYDRTENDNYPLYYMTSKHIFSVVTTGKPGFASQESKLTGQNIGYIELKPYTVFSEDVGYGYVIPKTAADPEKSMKILNLLYSDSYLANLLMYGLEGTHYTLTEENQIHLLPERGYSGINGYEYCNQYLANVLEGESPTLWEEIETANQTAEKSVAYGFAFDDTAVRQEVARCDQVCEEYLELLFSGQADPEMLCEEFCRELEEAGIQRIIEEKQRQLDLFLAKE